MPALRVNGRAWLAGVMFGMMMWLLYIRFIVPVLGVFYGTALMADEVEDKTITYLFTRPIPRGAVLVGKYLAYLVCTVLMVLPSVVVVYFLVAPLGGGSIAAGFRLLEGPGSSAAGLAAYGAVFAFVGARLKRPLVVGLVFVFGWEPGGLVSGLSQAVHGRLLPAGAGASRDAGRFGGGPVAVVLPEQYLDLAEPARVARDYRCLPGPGREGSLPPGICVGAVRSRLARIRGRHDVWAENRNWRQDRSVYKLRGWR